MKWTQKRRDFLRHAGIAALAAPAVHFWTDVAEAQPMANAKRAVLIFFPNAKGTNDGLATGSGANWSFIDGWEPLNPFKSQAIAISQYSPQSLINPAKDHRTSQGNSTINDGHVVPAQFAFTGGIPFSGNHDGATSPSIDQLIAQHNLATGAVTDPRLANMVIHVDGSHWAAGGGSRSVFRAADNGRNYNTASISQTDDAPMVKNPIDAWDLLFKPLMEAMGEETGPSLWAQGRSALDGTYKEMEAVKNQLPQEGRDIIEKHMMALRDLETGLAAEVVTIPGGFVVPAQPPGLQTNPANHVPITDLWFELIDAAFRSDRMRVFAMQFGGSASRFHIPELNKGYTGNAGDASNSGSDHHSYTHHQESGVRDFIRWYAQRLAALATRLQGDGSNANLLDSSVVMATMEHGHGSQHRADDVPTVLLGNAGGYYKTNQHIMGDNSNPTIPTGTLLSVCHAMGATQIQEVGYPRPQFHNGVYAPLRA